MKAIKSKEYRRQLNKSARRKAKTAAAADGDSSALKAAAESAEFERAKVTAILLLAQLPVAFQDLAFSSLTERSPVSKVARYPL